MPTKQKIRHIWIDGRHYEATSPPWAQLGDWDIWKKDQRERFGSKRMGKAHRLSGRRWQAQTQGYDDRSARCLIDLGTWPTLRQAVGHLDAREQADEAAYRAWEEEGLASKKRREILVTVPAPATGENGSDTIVVRLRRLAPPADGYFVLMPGKEIPVGIVTEIAKGKWEADRIVAPRFFTPTLRAAAREMAAMVLSPQNSVYARLQDAAEIEEVERPDDAVTCPLEDTPVHFTDCELCADRGWVLEAVIETYLGPHRVPCLFCDEEGWEDGAGPVTWTCSVCLGTGQMPVKALEEELLRGRWIEDQDLRGADLREVRLDRLLFSACDFSEAKLDGADLTDATFEVCQFRGANPELAASLERAVLTVYGLSEEQRAICVDRGATVANPEDEEDGPGESTRGQR